MLTWQRFLIHLACDHPLFFSQQSHKKLEASRHVITILLSYGTINQTVKGILIYLLNKLHVKKTRIEADTEDCILLNSRDEEPNILNSVR